MTEEIIPFKRKENWTSSEVEALVQAIADNKDILSGKLSMAITSERKGKCWEEVTARVNSVSVSNRTLKEVKKKWQTYQSNIKCKEARRLKDSKATGGGPVPSDLTNTEKAALSVIPKTMLCGISCGLDSAIDIDKEENTETVTATTSNSVCNASHEDVEIVTGTGAAKPCINKSEGMKKRKTNTNCDNADDYQAKLIKIEERRLEIEEERLLLQREQVAAIKEIAHYFTNKHIQSLLEF